ncbi:MAG: fumarate reductase/succinate dehydrogenase flavoprotein domain protein [Geminicoccaceae bacterium]|nr:fumarate reductase/succinate dehydrogenase flavoprotein domain protein [Geminicoccaceae bacterium]
MSTREVDLLVLGSGAGGMTAALTGSLLGLEVELLEKAAVVGGSTALSAGSVWIPNSHHAPAGSDSLDRARRYLRATVGDRLRPELCEGFLGAGPPMVRFLEERSAVRLRAYRHHPDYLAEADGATLAGRALEPMPFDGRRLGRDFQLLRDPLPEFTLLGGMMVDRSDAGQLLNATRSLACSWHALRLLTRYGIDRLRHHRGTRLVMGNALAGRLLLSLRSQSVAIRTRAEVVELVERQGRIEGVVLAAGTGPRRLLARRGVVLATGGFSRHPKLRRELLPEPTPAHSPLVATVTGDGIELGRAIGGRLGEGHADAAFWAPVSVRQRRDGSTAVFPHFVLDRGKPGLIAVDSGGRRFVNEATTYHRFGQAIYAAHRVRPTIPCCFVCDHRFVVSYGLGMVRPRGLGLASAVADGYLTRADTLPGLAAALGIDPLGLERTVARHNEFARTGVDLEFAKGSDAYQQNLGDPAHGPNPCLGPLEAPPFYALRVYPGDIGASVGLVTDANARVLRADDRPVPGLYACGNDMDSLMAGTYPGPGITLGPAMTFGYLAARHAAATAPP